MSKVIAVGEPGRPMALIEEARRLFAGRASPTVSHPRFLEFVAPGVSKGRAVAWLAHRAGIPMGQVLTMGDALNDFEMISDAGHGAAMATAPAEVRGCRALHRGAGGAGRGGRADRGAGAGAARGGGPERRAPARRRGPPGRAREALAAGAVA